MKQALLAIAVLTLSCTECGGGIKTAHSKLSRPAHQATAVGTVERKRGLVGDAMALRNGNTRSTNKSYARRQLAVKQGRAVRLANNQHATRRKRPGRTASNAKSSKGQSATLGLASFYSDDRETASGERFDGHQLSAAHPSLPFGTRLRVTNVMNGNSVTVRINDRGPFVHGRIIDVTSAAAEALGMVNTGVAKVTLDVLP